MEGLYLIRGGSQAEREKISRRLQNQTEQYFKVGLEGSAHAFHSADSHVAPTHEIIVICSKSGQNFIWENDPVGSLGKAFVMANEFYGFKSIIESNEAFQKKLKPSDFKQKNPRFPEAGILNLDLE